MPLLDRSSSPLTGNPIPDYLRNVYAWEYLTPWLTGLLDRQVVVQAILWGNAQRLIRDVLAAVKSGDRIIRPAAVYGSFSRQLAEQIGRHERSDARHHSVHAYTALADPAVADPGVAREDFARARAIARAASTDACPSDAQYLWCYHGEWDAGCRHLSDTTDRPDHVRY
jgi:hypothetical protein